MFWNKMSAQDIEKIVGTAVEKATAKSEAVLAEERKRTNYLKASQSGQFKTRAGIYEYFRAYEGLDPDEAGRITDLECKYRGIGEDGKAPEEPKEKGAMEQIGSELTGYLVRSLKEDPMGTITNVGQIVGGAVTFGTGLLAGKAVEDKEPTPSVPTNAATEQPQEPSAPPMSYEELKARQAGAQATEDSQTNI